VATRRSPERRRRGRDRLPSGRCAVVSLLHPHEEAGVGRRACGRVGRSHPYVASSDSRLACQLVERQLARSRASSRVFPAAAPASDAESSRPTRSYWTLRVTRSARPPGLLLLASVSSVDSDESRLAGTIDGFYYLLPTRANSLRSHLTPARTSGAIPAHWRRRGRLPRQFLGFRAEAVR
jgi:hypothetical protein